MSLGRTCLTGKKDTGIGKNYMLCGRGEQLNCLGHGIWKAVPNTLLNISVTVHAFFFAFFSHRPDQVSNSLPSAPKLSAQITTETSTKNVLRKALFGTRMWRDLNIAQREIGEREKKGMERGKRDERNEHYFGLQFFSHLYLISFNNNLLGSSTLKQTITFFQTVGPCSGQSRCFFKTWSYLPSGVCPRTPSILSADITGITTHLCSLDWSLLVLRTLAFSPSSPTLVCTHTWLSPCLSVCRAVPSVGDNHQSKEFILVNLKAVLSSSPLPQLLLVLKVSGVYTLTVLVYTDNTTKVLTEGIFSPFPHNTHWSVWKQMAQTSRTSLISLSTTWP